MNFDIRKINTSIRTNYMIYQALLTIITIIILGILFIIFGDSYQSIYIYSWVGNVVFVGSIYLYYRATEVIFSPYIMLYTSFFLFQFGQMLLYSFNINYDYVFLGYYSNFWDNKTSVVLLGTAFVIVSISLFNLGALIVINKSILSSKVITKLNMIRFETVEITAWIIFGISIIPTLLTKINQMIFSIKHGYGALYSGNLVTSSTMNLLGSLFIPSCILLIIIYNNNKVLTKYIKITMLVYAVVGLIVGGRTISMSVIVVLLAYKLHNFSDMNIKKTLLIVVSVYLLMTITVTFAYFRGIENKNLNNFTEVFIETISQRNPVVSTIGEMGWSMGTIFMTIDIVPREISFDYGKSYIASVFRLIPSSLDPFNVISSIHNKSSEISNMLTDYYDVDFGMDSTLIGESFYNFGLFGVLISLILGYFIGTLTGFTRNDKTNNNIILTFIRYVMLFSLFTLPRRHLGYMFMQIFYNIIFFILLIILLQKLFDKYHVFNSGIYIKLFKRERYGDMNNEN